MMYNFDGIFLRKVESEDLLSLKQLKSESWFGTHSVSFINTENQNAWFESLNKEDVICPKNLILMAFQMYSDVIGVFKITNIHWVNRSADVAWDLFSIHRGKKLGKPLISAGTSFCFEILNLRRLNAEILYDNFPSKKCALGVGYVLEGKKRAAVDKQGHLFDSEIYGILSQDWFSKNNHTVNELLRQNA